MTNRGTIKQRKKETETQTEKECNKEKQTKTSSDKEKWGKSYTERHKDIKWWREIERRRRKRQNKLSIIVI